MVRLLESDILTKEVLSWKGLHLFHAHTSTCSQKVRICLNLKELDWTSHELSLRDKENLTPYYLGVNPRGLVPTLVHDGAVHIESNDIILYLDETFPARPLTPTAHRGDIATLLQHEDDMHLDLRALTFRFVLASLKPKSAEDLKTYAERGSGTVQGKADPHKASEIAFWEAFTKDGLSDDDARAIVMRFKDAFDDLDKRLAHQPYLLGDTLSALDVAWFVYVVRLRFAGYPFERLHPRIQEWFGRLSERDAFAREVAPPPPMAALYAANRAAQVKSGRTLEAVAGWT
jgi:glutathione S-transferase